MNGPVNMKFQSGDYVQMAQYLDAGAHLRGRTSGGAVAYVLQRIDFDDGNWYYELLDGKDAQRVGYCTDNAQALRQMIERFGWRAASWETQY